MDLTPYSDILINLGAPPSTHRALGEYLRLLWASNEDMNLISRQMTEKELIENHLIDCLLPVRHFPLAVKQVADFGSGGGLPGVIYAILFPETEFHLFEKSPKKQGFLNSCRKIAPNIQIHGEIPLDLKGVDLITARAFKPIDVILQISQSYFKKNGKYFLLKARREKIDEELNDSKKKLKTLNFEIKPLKSPLLDVERHLVLINP